MSNCRHREIEIRSQIDAARVGRLLKSTSSLSFLSFRADCCWLIIQYLLVSVIKESVHNLILFLYLEVSLRVLLNEVFVVIFFFLIVEADLHVERQLLLLSFLMIESAWFVRLSMEILMLDFFVLKRLHVVWLSH